MVSYIVVVSPEPCLVETYLGKASKDGGQEWKGLHLEVLDTNTRDKAKNKIGSRWRRKVLSTQEAGVSGPQQTVTTFPGSMQGRTGQDLVSVITLNALPLTT